MPLVVCVTDGLPTVPLVAGGDPLDDALLEARALRRAGVGLVVADTGTGGPSRGACGELAEAGGGTCVGFGQLVPASLRAAARPDRGRVLTPDEAAALEACLDARLGPEQAGPDRGKSRRSRSAIDLAPFTVERPIEWAARTLPQGEILAGFAAHCRDELDDVEVVEEAPALLVARWRRETSRVELRAGLVAFERLASDDPTMLLTDLDQADVDALVARFVDEPELRNTLAIYDLGRLEKIGAVRSSVFVYFEWFLRDAYGVKLLLGGVHAGPDRPRHHLARIRVMIVTARLADDDRRTASACPSTAQMRIRRREPRRRRYELSPITRRALAEHLGLADGGSRKLPFAALGRSGYRNTAQDMEEILAREWADDIDRDRDR